MLYNVGGKRTQTSKHIALAESCKKGDFKLHRI